MTVQNSVPVRNAMLDAKEAAIGPSARLQCRTGAPPLNCAAADAGALLAEFVLSADWSPAAAAGAKSLAAVTPVAAVAAGVMGHYRVKDNAGTVCHEQGVIGQPGPGIDLAVDNPTVVVGQQVSVSGWTMTAPGA